jgi:hypothetical protein
MDCVWNEFFLERHFLVKSLAQYLIKYCQSVLKNVSDSTSRPYEVCILRNGVIYCAIMFTF